MKLLLLALILLPVLAILIAVGTPSFDSIEPQECREDKVFCFDGNIRE